MTIVVWENDRDHREYVDDRYVGNVVDMTWRDEAHYHFAHPVTGVWAYGVCNTVDEAKHEIEALVDRHSK